MLVSAQCVAARDDVSSELQQLLFRDNQKRSAKIGTRLIELGNLLRSTLQTFAQDRRAPFIDLNQTMAAEVTILRDYVHLTVLGEQRLAAGWAVGLAPLLEGRPDAVVEESNP